MQTSEAHPLGCLVTLSASDCSAESRPIQVLLAAERRRNRAGLLACVACAVAVGELPDGSDATALATMFGTFLLGLSIQARDGVPLAALEASIAQLMSVWDALAIPSIDSNEITQA